MYPIHTIMLHMHVNRCQIVCQRMSNRTKVGGNVHVFSIHYSASQCELALTDVCILHWLLYGPLG